MPASVGYGTFAYFPLLPFRLSKLQVSVLFLFPFLFLYLWLCKFLLLFLLLSGNKDASFAPKDLQLASRLPTSGVLESP